MSWFILAKQIVLEEVKSSKISKAFEKDNKTKSSMLLYTTGVIFSWVQPMVSIIIYVGVAALWFIPDTRIEKSLKK